MNGAVWRARNGNYAILVGNSGQLEGEFSGGSDDPDLSQWRRYLNQAAFQHVKAYTEWFSLAGVSAPDSGGLDDPATFVEEFLSLLGARAHDADIADNADDADDVDE